eukprot:5614723-Alexandrium_andersonii.AAC.1
MKDVEQAYELAKKEAGEQGREQRAHGGHLPCPASGSAPDGQVGVAAPATPATGGLPAASGASAAVARPPAASSAAPVAGGAVDPAAPPNQNSTAEAGAAAAGAGGGEQRLRSRSPLRPS